MKKLFIISGLLMIGILFTAAVLNPAYIDFPVKHAVKASVIQSSDDKNQHKEFNVTGKGKLTLDLRTGSAIDIEGWDKNIVSVDVTISGKNAEDIQVEFDQHGNDVEVSSYYDGYEDSYNSGGKFVIKMPKNFNLEFSTMGGDVKLKDVSGEFSGKTMGGELEIYGVKGELDLSTMGGDITVKDCEVDGQVHTMGGEVIVENVVGDLSAKTMGGKIKQTNVKSKSGDAGSEVNISTMGGDIDVDRALSGAKVKTMGGDIKVINAVKFVEAETYGGDININSIDGYVKAKTMGGDVEVTMVGDPNVGDRSVSLTSMGGDVVLTVPPGLSMDVDIEIAYTKDEWNKKGEVNIYSDFDIVKKEKSKEWDDSKGTPRKYLSGKGEVNGGKHKIKIRTTNGDVYLKKS